MIDPEMKKMGYLQNLHTHSTFDHGIDTPEEMIGEAIRKGFDSVGFSGHSYLLCAAEFTMSEAGTEKYKKEILRLKKEYAKRIKIYLGLELDMLSDTPVGGYDYLIGSMHYIKMGEDLVGVDRDAEYCQKAIREYFGGNGLEFAKEYFRQITLLPQRADIDILAHFDLIAKHVDRVNVFDCHGREYLSAAVEALEALRKDISFFEINTGGMARGFRKTPYPMPDILKEMRRLGFGAVITSDCHDARLLDFGFDEAAALLKAAGFKEKYVLTAAGFQPTAL